MNRFVSLCCIAVFTQTIAFAVSDEFVENGINYRVISAEDRTVEICPYFIDEHSILPSPPQQEVSLRPFMSFTGNAYEGNITIPATVTIDIDGLTEQYTVKRIGYGAFAQCNALTGVSIEAEIDMIDEGAFANCSGLVELVIPDCCRAIGDYAFAGCANMQRLKWPASAYTVGSHTCAGLGIECQDAVALDGINGVGNIRDFAFLNANITRFPDFTRLDLVCWSAFKGTGITELDLSKISITSQSFSDGCFDGMNLETLILPSPCPDYIELAFGTCFGIKMLRTNDALPPEVNYSYTLFVHPKCVLEVPDGCVDAYANHPKWSGFTKIIPHSASLPSLVASDSEFEIRRGCIRSFSSRLLVYDLQGVLLYNGEGTVDLSPGYYILANGKWTKKALVP